MEKVTLQEKNPQRDIEYGPPTYPEQVNGMTHIGDSITEETPTEDVLTPHRTHKRGNGHQSVSGEFKILQRDKETSPTRKEDYSIKAPQENIRIPM